MSNEIIITSSIDEIQKIEVARMFYRAFLKKFSTIWLFTKNESHAITVLRDSINFHSGLYALCDNKVLGFVGLENGTDFYTHLSHSSLSKAFSIHSASWRYLAYMIYRIFHGKVKSDVVHIDPIVVSDNARGMGIGTRLLEATFEYAKKLHRKKIILEVVDTNPKAKKLYEKMGFKVIKEENTSLLTKDAGFEMVVHMEKELDSDKDSTLDGNY